MIHPDPPLPENLGQNGYSSSQFSFGKRGENKNNKTNSIKNNGGNLLNVNRVDTDSGEKVRVSIPIDWEYIIEKHIKNTNTNVIEIKKN